MFGMFSVCCIIEFYYTLEHLCSDNESFQGGYKLSIVFVFDKTKAFVLFSFPCVLIETEGFMLVKFKRNSWMKYEPDLPKLGHKVDFKAFSFVNMNVIKRVDSSSRP